jgi:hypothetical protein
MTLAEVQRILGNGRVSTWMPWNPGSEDQCVVSWHETWVADGIRCIRRSRDWVVFERGVATEVHLSCQASPFDRIREMAGFLMEAASPEFGPGQYTVVSRALTRGAA